jgi:hypothetical protein
MRANVNFVCFLALHFNPNLKDITGEDIASQKELMVLLQSV